MRKAIFYILLLLIPFAASAQAQNSAPNPADYTLREVASGFTRPLLVTHAPDGSGRLFVVEQDGRIKIVQNGSVLSAPFLNVSTLVSRGGSEQGLLGLAFHPNYTQNGWFFINYTNSQGDTVVARYAVSSNPNVANASSAVTILTVDQPYSNHNGGNLVFGPDGYLYIGLGDGGSGGDPQNRAQNPQTLLGKMLRINVNQLPYTIPTNNPFVNNTSFLPEIWALGVRNPWRYSFDRATGDLYIGDVGQNAWEEVDFQPATSSGGENYGWNIFEGSQPYKGGSLPGAVMPVAEYAHSTGGCSVTGGYVYRGTRLPALQGVYFYGDFCSGVIWSLYRDSGGRWVSAVFKETGFPVSSFGEDQQGELYVADYSGRVLRLESVNPPPTNTATPTATRTPTQTPSPSNTPVPTATQTPLPTLTLTPLPTNSPVPTATQTLLPTTTPTLAPTLTQTPLPANSPTLTQTPLPTNTPEPTATWTPTSEPSTSTPVPPGAASVRVDVVPASANPGETVIVAINLLNVAGLYGLQSRCVVDPAVLAGVGRADGDGFNANNSYFVDSGYQADGSWLVAASRLAPNPPISGSATAFSLLYSVQANGSSPVTCDIIGVDEDGHVLALQVVNGSFNGAPPVTATVEPTGESTTTPTPETTLETTATLSAGLSAISGTVAYQNRPDNGGISVRLLGADSALIVETVTAANGVYSFAGVPVGIYSIQASAPQHISLLRRVTVEADGQMVEAGSDLLPAGDTDDNGVIDVVDATFVGANFDVEVPPAPGNADLNGDGLVNIGDLVLVGGNFGLAGPVMLE